MHEADIGKKREEERRREKKKQGKKSYYMLILEENEEDDRAFSSRPSSDNFRLPLTIPIAGLEKKVYVCVYSHFRAHIH